MKLSGAVLDTLTRYVAKFPVPHGEPGPAIEEQVRQWTKGAIEQVVFEHPTDGFGWKRADGGRPPSKDGMANMKMDAGRLLNFDLVTGAGTGNGSFVGASSNGEDITGQVFMPLDGVDHLNGDRIPVPPVPPTPQPGVDQFAIDLIALYLRHKRDVPSPEIIALHRTNPGGLAAIDQQLTADDPPEAPSDVVVRLERIEALVRDLANKPAGSAFKLTPAMLAAVLPLIQPMITQAMAGWMKDNPILRLTATPKKTAKSKGAKR